MGRIIQPDDLATRLAKIESDIRALQTAPSLGNSSIKDGALTIFDAAGVPRVILGKDPADSVYGFKVKAADSSTILDAIGLIQGMKSLNSASIAWGTTTFAGVNSGGSPVSGFGGEVSLMNFNFTTTRTVTLLPFCMVHGGVVSTAGIMGIAAPLYMRITGQANSTIGALSIRSSTDTQGVFYVSTTPYQLISLPAATYTINCYWNSVNGTQDTLTVKSARMDVFQIGG